MASTGGEASWRGVPDSDEVLYRRAQSGASDAAAPADAAPIGRAPVLVYEDDSLDMRVGDRASKRRRIISGVNKETVSPGGTVYLPAQKEAAGTIKRQDNKQSKLLELAPGPLPSNWTVSARRKPANKAMGAPAERALLYHAPTGETFKTYGKARTFWRSKGQRVRRAQGGPTAVPSGPGSPPGRQLPPGWQVATNRRSSTSSRPGEAYKVYMAPSGEKFRAWKDVEAFCARKGIKLPSSQPGKGASGQPATAQDIVRGLRQLAVGKLKSKQDAMMEALLRARIARNIKPRRGPIK